MLRSVNDLCAYRFEALDGHIGKPYEFCFDDQTWELRYAVIETGHWLLGNNVLISMDRFGLPEPDERKFPVALTLQQVQDSPSIEADKPVYLWVWSVFVEVSTSCRSTRWFSTRPTPGTRVA